jgi:hypothetical protein
MARESFRICAGCGWSWVREVRWRALVLRRVRYFGPIWPGRGGAAAARWISPAEFADQYADCWGHLGPPPPEVKP